MWGKNDNIQHLLMIKKKKTLHNVDVEETDFNLVKLTSYSMVKCQKHFL